MSPDRYVAYLRVSTTKQALSGLGIEAQREAIHQHLRHHGGNLLAELVETESGAHDGRLRLAEALALCRERRAKLLVAKLDRLARSVSFVSAVMDSDVQLVAADNPHASRLVLHMLAAVAEFEREQISARTKAALAAAKARGVKLGVHGRALAAKRKSEAACYARTVAPVIEVARAGGAQTLSQIAFSMNQAGVPSRGGGLWHPASVRRVLGRLEGGC